MIFLKSISRFQLPVVDVFTQGIHCDYISYIQVLSLGKKKLLEIVNPATLETEVLNYASISHLASVYAVSQAHKIRDH